MGWFFDDEKDKAKDRYDGGYGLFGSQSSYWQDRYDSDGNKTGETDIFPGGQPNGSSRNGDSHEHVVIDKDDNVTYWRDSDGDVLIDSRSNDPIRY